MKRTLQGVLMFGALTLAISCASHSGSQAPSPQPHAIFASTLVDEQPAEPATQPANMPELPAGHPNIFGGATPSTQPDQAMPALPPGHPDLSSMMGGNAPAGQLPAGHPDISKMSPAPGQATKFASVTVRAEQGTIGGPVIGAESVTVEVVTGDQVVGRINTKLNPDGTISIGGLPIGPMYQPLVTVKHGGVSYQAVGGPIDGKPQIVTVKVYETTDQPVAWEMRMRHIMLQPGATGVQVMDMLAIDNATDRAYIGMTGADGSRTTFQLPLPPGATDVQLLGGFQDGATKVTGGMLVSGSAIAPGNTQYQLSYTVPHKDGVSEIVTSAPVTTKQFIVFAPDDGTQIAAEGLESGTTTMGDSPMRYFKGAAIPAGREVKLTVTGAPTRSAVKSKAAAGSALPMDYGQLAKGVAGVGVLVVFLIGGAMLFRRGGSASPSNAEPQ